MKNLVFLFFAGIISFSGCCDSVNDENHDILLKIGDITEIKSGKTAYNAQYDLSLRVNSVNDSRCPIGLSCFWQGYVSVQLFLTTKSGNYDFSLSTLHVPTYLKVDTVIEGMKYRLTDVLPYPVFENEQLKRVKIYVGSHLMPDNQRNNH